MTLKLQNLDTFVAADVQAGRTVISQVATDTVCKAIRAANF